MIRSVDRRLSAVSRTDVCSTATVSQHSTWDTSRVAREWGRRRTRVLDAQHSGSLAATVELSLASPMFQDLGPDARDLLGVVAFFPQGIDENNLEWLFPTITRRNDIFDKFCVLSLAYRNDDSITMLTPLRDHLCPKNPISAPLLCPTKERYFSRLSVDVNPDRPGFGEAKWITSEDVNVEHLLDVFTTIDVTSGDVWGACADFMKHLSWHKSWRAILGPRSRHSRTTTPPSHNACYQLSRSFQIGWKSYQSAPHSRLEVPERAGG
jgi:hypothetical protein